MKKTYQISRRRAAEKFRKLALANATPIQLTFPLADFAELAQGWRARLASPHREPQAAQSNHQPPGSRMNTPPIKAPSPATQPIREASSRAPVPQHSCVPRSPSCEHSGVCEKRRLKSGRPVADRYYKVRVPIRCRRNAWNTATRRPYCAFLCCLLLRVHWRLKSPRLLLN
jgi:hypothetical protein